MKNRNAILLTLTFACSQIVCVGTSKLAAEDASTSPTRIDLNHDTQRQVVVDRGPGQYLGHPTTCLLKTAKRCCVCTRRVMVVEQSCTSEVRMAVNVGERLPTPASWSTSKEVPTLHRVVDASGKKRIILWSGLYPARLAITEDDGINWSELQPAGDWGGIVVMGFVEPLKPGRVIIWRCFMMMADFFPKTENGQTSSSCSKPNLPMVG